MWVLIICIGVSVMGCGGMPSAEFEKKEDCYEALREIRFQERGKLQTGEDATDSLAYCMPKNG